MKNKYALILMWILMVSGVAGLLLTHMHNKPQQKIDLINKTGSKFSVEIPLFPTKKSLHKTLEAKPLILNFWASWCLACRKDHAMLMAIRSLYTFPIYGIDYRDSKINANRWLKQYGNPFTTIIFDPTGKIAKYYGVRGTPETFVIDKHGIIQYHHVGSTTWNDWKEKIIPLMEKLKK